MSWKKIWRKVDPWLDRDKYAVTTFSVFAALLMLHAELSKEPVRSNKDLKTLSATFAEYSFIDGERGRHYYYIWFQEYRARFKVPADYLGFFQKVAFKSKTQRGDVLRITIARSSIDRLQKNNETIFLRGLRSSSDTYLSSYSVIQKERGLGMFIFCGGLFAAGILFYFFRKKFLQKKGSTSQ